MRPDIEARLRTVFTSGYLDEPNADAFLSELSRWRNALSEAVQRRPRFALAYAGNGFRGTVHEFAVTDSAYPSYEQWTELSRGGDGRRLEWLDANGGVYPVLWINISRVWPAVDWYFNLWQRRKDNGNIHATNPPEPMDDGWRDLLDDVVSSLRSVGVERLSAAELDEPVPFVIERVWPPDEDDLADTDEDVQWIEEPASVAQCLFQPY